MKKRRKSSVISRVVFRIFKFFARLFYKKTEIIGLDKAHTNDVIFVANHAQLNGPIIGELFMPENCYIWANGQMVRAREVPKYAMEDFFPYKRGLTRPFYKLASYLLAPLLPCIINNARAIPVFRDARIVSTLKNTVRHLSEGNTILIFPECHEKRNNIVNEFQKNFVEVARLYHRRFKRTISFVPMYIAPDLGKVYVGEGISFDPLSDPSCEKERIVNYLMSSITAMGRSLPEHTVVPFDNISRKQYITNKNVDALPES